MLDQVPVARPRVALVYGDAGAASHLRDAVAGHVQIVYATAASEFDPARLADSRASAALLNLDSCEWLDAVESRLHAAGVAVVYNDPEISRTLEGWAQARWLRHLTAKLSGSTDFDPPRPASVPVTDALAPLEAPAAQPEQPASASRVPQASDAQPAQPPAPSVAVQAATPADAPAEVMEQPLSLAEIASMTVNFNAVPEVSLAAAIEPAPAQVIADAGVDPEPAVAAPTLPDPEPAVDEPAPLEPGAGVEALALTDAEPASTPEPAADSPLDVDTEALSALIDARLAEAEGHAPGDSPQVWRVAHGGAVSAVDLAPGTEPGPTDAGQPAAGALAPPVDEAELLQGLPAIGDWQLVDRDAPAAPAKPAAPAPRDEPAFDIDFAGLELVPMEPVAQVELHAEPIERWMHVAAQDAHKPDEKSQPDTEGDRA